MNTFKQLRMRNYLLTILTCLFVLVAYVLPIYVGFVGLLIILLLLIGLNDTVRGKISVVLLILSPIATYPLFLLLFVFTRSIPLWAFIFYLALYGFLLRNVWSWIEPHMKNTLVVCLAVVSFVTLFGVPTNTTSSGKYSEIIKTIFTAVTVIPAYGGLLLVFLFGIWKLKSHTGTKR